MQGACVAGSVAAGLILLASCGSGSTDSPRPLPTVDPTGTSLLESARDRATSQALAVYRGMWQAMAKAAETADSQSPELAMYATGDALGVLNRSLYADKLSGVVSKGRPTNDPTVSNVDPADNPTTIMVKDCSDSSNWLKYKGDKPVDATPGGRRSITAEVKKQQDGSWRVTRFAVEKVGSC